MSMEKDRFLKALDDDQAALGAAGEIFGACMTDMPQIPGAVGQAGAYAQAVISSLYAQLELAMQDLPRFEQLLAEEMEEAHAAALALMACLVHRPEGSRMEALLDARALRLDPAAAVSCFAVTPMDGVFAGAGSYPCLPDGQVRRLGLILGAVFYGAWIRLYMEKRQAEPESAGLNAELDTERNAELDTMVECADLGAMTVWGFAAAELLCAEKSERKAEGYARAVSMVALANLPLTLQADSYAVLAGCIRWMFAGRERLLDALRSLCRTLEMRPSEEGHLRIDYPEEQDYDEAAWIAAFEANAVNAPYDMQAHTLLWTDDFESDGDETDEE